MSHQRTHRKQPAQTYGVAIFGAKHHVQHNWCGTHQHQQQAQGNYLNPALGVAPQDATNGVKQGAYHIKSSGIT